MIELLINAVESRWYKLSQEQILFQWRMINVWLEYKREEGVDRIKNKYIYIKISVQLQIGTQANTKKKVKIIFLFWMCLFFSVAC